MIKLTENLITGVNFDMKTLKTLKTRKDTPEFVTMDYVISASDGNECAGGLAIADTGDFSELRCPHCDSKLIDMGYIVMSAAWAGWQAAVKVEREACADVCRKRARAMRETIRTANPRTSEHIMLRRDAREDEARECATAIMER